MNGKWTSEEVREQADRVGIVGEDCGRTKGMLAYIAERIEADEMAVPVAKIRHFNYHGIARNRFSQEAQMLDGVQELPEGTELFTRPPAQAAQVTDAFAVLEKLGWEWVNGRWCADIADPSTHPHSPDAADSGRVDDVSFSTVEEVVKALCRIGHTFPESQEEQAARFESLVLDLCRSVQSHFDGLTALAAKGRVDAFAPIPEAKDAPTDELWNAYNVFNDHYCGFNTQQALRYAINNVLAHRAALAAQGQGDAVRCCCGDPSAPGVRHRSDGPCYVGKNGVDYTPPASPAGVPDVFLQLLEMARRVPKWTGRPIPENCCSDTDFNDAIEAAHDYLSAPSATPEAIPGGVVYRIDSDNFYDDRTRAGKGCNFWNQWNARKAEFPTEYSSATPEGGEVDRG